MKRNSFKWCVYTFLFLGIGMVSCADEDLMTYEDVPRIYFKYADASSSDFGENEDQITVNMGYDRPLKNDSIIKIHQTNGTSFGNRPGGKSSDDT